MQQEENNCLINDFVDFWQKPEGRERIVTQSMQACDNLTVEQHLVSFWNMDPENITELKLIT